MSKDDTWTPDDEDAARVAEVIQTGKELEQAAGDGAVSGEVVRTGDMGLGQYIDSVAVEGRTAEEVAYMAIIQQIFDSETPEDVLTPIEAVNAKDVIGRPVRVKRWEAVRSEYEVGSPFYAAIQVDHLDTSEQGVITTGNQAILAQLITLQSRDAFPIEGKFVEFGKPNKYGTMPMRLAKPEWESKKTRRQPASG